MRRIALCVAPWAVVSALSARAADRAPEVDASTFEHALRLARELHDDRAVLALLEARARSAGATEQDVAALLAALEEAGEPGRAAAFLEERLRERPAEDATRVRLAELLARSGHSARAAQAWRALEARGVTLTTSQRDEYARALARTGDLDGAYRVLAEGEARAEPDARAYRDDLASLAWQRDDARAALDAHRKLWAMGDRRATTATRLATLAGEAGSIDEAIAAGLEAARASHDVEPLLVAAGAARDHADWTRARRALDAAESLDRSVRRDVRYWSIRADARRHTGDRAGARVAYREMLAIDPASSEAKSALLEDTIDGDEDELRDDVARWRGDAERDPALWDAYADALERLGRSSEAVAFFAREVEGGTHGAAVLLRFSEALDRVGDAELAWRVRRRALARLSPADAERERRGAAFERALDDDDRGALADLTQDPRLGDASSRHEAQALLDRARAERAPDVRAGATWEHVAVLDGYGPDAAVSHGVGPVRLTYGLQARRLVAHADSLDTAGAVDEADLLAAARATREREALEVAAGASWQPGTPLPRASVLAERTLGRDGFARARLATGDPIEDTALLRLAARASSVELDAREELGRSAYARVEVRARADATRRYELLGKELDEAGEAGVKLLRGAPSWELGVQALAQQRDNVSTLPSSLGPYLPLGSRSPVELPPTYELVSVVTHVARGDFAERQLSAGGFPRYDCTAAVGVLLPDRTAAAEAECAMGVRVSRSGWVSATALVNRGVLGIAPQTNALASVALVETF